MKIYSYDNHIFDKNIINNLIYTSKNNIQIKDDFYILINFTSYKKHTLHNKNDILYNLSVNEINYNNDITIPKETGLIVSTAGSNKTKNDTSHDLQSLIQTWNDIKEHALNSVAPSLIHQESDIIKRTMRDM